MLPKCPSRKNSLQFTQLRYRDPFPCPLCSQLLYIPHAYTVARTWAILLISAAGLYFIGLRGYSLVLGAILAWVPALILDAILVRAFFPPIIRTDKNITSNFTTLNL
ncbi:MAG: hypothetical protein DMG96_41340 [Acidobacteria bacterium]|nr:MAG: hypothetical protein DMG96_41340 [Acidobacteriota bacterium]